MNFFESELKKIMRNSAILKDQKYVGRMCYGTIGGDLRARVEFVTLGVSDHYAGIKASIINRKEGVVDSVLLRFTDIWGKQKVSNPNFKEGMNPHIWTNSGKSEWYVFGSGRVPEGCRHRGKLSVHISEYGDDAGESGLYHADGDIGSGKQEGGKLCLYLILWPRLSWTRYLTGYMGKS